MARGSFLVLDRHWPMSFMFIIFIWVWCLSPAIVMASAGNSPLDNQKSSVTGSGTGTTGSIMTSGTGNSGTGTAGKPAITLVGNGANRPGGTGTAASFLYSVLPLSTSTNGVPNPYPVRTMIGNLMFRLRQHRAQMLIIPSLLRIVYQYRRPIVDGISTAYQSLMAAPGEGAGAASAGGARISESANGNDYGTSTEEDDPMMASSSTSISQPSIARFYAPTHQIPTLIPTSPPLYQLLGMVAPAPAMAAYHHHGSLAVPHHHHHHHHHGTFATYPFGLTAAAA